MTDIPKWPGPIAWRTSWDHLVHAFPELGELNSQAICRHVAATNSLQEPPEWGRRCEACRMIREAQLQVRRERAQQWVYGGPDFVANAPEPAIEPPRPHPGKTCGCRACALEYGFE